MHAIFSTFLYSTFSLLFGFDIIPISFVLLDILYSSCAPHVLMSLPLLLLLILDYLLRCRFYFRFLFRTPLVFNSLADLFAWSKNKTAMVNERKMYVCRMILIHVGWLWQPHIWKYIRLIRRSVDAFLPYHVVFILSPLASFGLRSDLNFSWQIFASCD